MIKKTLLSFVAVLSLAASLFAQEPALKPVDDWHPIASYPFLYPEFREAVIFTTSMQRIKTKANVHVGSHYVWYESKGKILEVGQGIAAKVEFTSGEVFFAIGNRMCRMIREDSIDGQLCRLYVSIEVDKEQFEREAHGVQAMSTMMSNSAFGGAWASAVSDGNSNVDIETQPMPLFNRYYMLYKGETLEATERNVLRFLTKPEKREYNAFIRSSDALAGGRSQMENIWVKFFVKK